MKLSEKIKMTKPGMVHWAGTGPSGKECWECRHFYDERYHEFSVHIKGVKARCLLATKNNRGHKGPEFSGDTPACSRFDPFYQSPGGDAL